MLARQVGVAQDPVARDVVSLAQLPLEVLEELVDAGRAGLGGRRGGDGPAHVLDQGLEVLAFGVLAEFRGLLLLGSLPHRHRRAGMQAL